MREKHRKRKKKEIGQLVWCVCIYIIYRLKKIYSFLLWHLQLFVVCENIIVFLFSFKNVFSLSILLFFFLEKKIL